MRYQNLDWLGSSVGTSERLKIVRSPVRSRPKPHHWIDTAEDLSFDFGRNRLNGFEKQLRDYAVRKFPLLAE